VTTISPVAAKKLNHDGTKRMKNEIAVTPYS